MATEYIFFDADLRERFVQAVAARALACQVREDAMEGFVVRIADEPADDVLEALEAEYEALMDEQMLRAEARPDWVARSLMERFTAEEAHALVSAIAHSLENPVDGPLCHKG